MSRGRGGADSRVVAEVRGKGVGYVTGVVGEGGAVCVDDWRMDVAVA